MNPLKDATLYAGDAHLHAQIARARQTIADARMDGVVSPEEQAQIDQLEELVNGLQLVNETFDTPGSSYTPEYGAIASEFPPDNLSRHQPSVARPYGFGGRTRPGFEYGGLDTVVEDAYTRRLWDEIADRSEVANRVMAQERMNALAEQRRMERLLYDLNKPRGGHQPSSYRHRGHAARIRPGFEYNSLDGIAADAVFY